jgi:hypothetical protein
VQGIVCFMKSRNAGKTMTGNRPFLPVKIAFTSPPGSPIAARMTGNTGKKMPCRNTAKEELLFLILTPFFLL